LELKSSTSQVIYLGNVEGDNLQRKRQGVEMTKALYADMNNKKIKIK
jgi:hypothetical protein